MAGMPNKVDSTTSLVSNDMSGKAEKSPAAVCTETDSGHGVSIGPISGLEVPDTKSELHVDTKTYETGLRAKSKNAEHPMQDSPSTKLVPTEAIVALIDSMLATPDDEELQLKAIISLRKFSTNDGLRQFIGESGGVAVVSTVMRAYPRNEHLVINSFMLLANLAFENSENKDLIRKVNTIEKVISLMGQHQEHEEIQGWACLALRNFSNNNKNNQMRLANGGIESITKAMKRFTKSKQVQIHGSAALGNVAAGDLTCQMRCRDLGGINVILDAMQDNVLSSSLQEHGIVAIRNLCVKNQKNQRRIGELGGIELLVQAMTAHQDVRSIQLKACAAIRYLAYDATNRELLGRNGALTMIVKALEIIDSSSSHGTEEADHILKAMSNATFDNSENKRVLGRCNGIDVVFTVLEAHSQAPEIQESCLRVLRNISDGVKENCTALLKRGVLQKCLRNMEKFKTHAGINEHSIALLYNLTCYEPLAEEHGTCIENMRAVVVERLEIFADNPAVQSEGRDLVINLNRLKRIKTATTVRRDRNKGSVLGRFMSRKSPK